MDIMTKAVVGNSCRIRSFTQFEIKTLYLYRGFESIPEYFLNKLKDRDEQNAK